MKYQVLGMMSGTSLDGLDLACCVFEKKNDNWVFKLEKAATIRYEKEWQQKLEDAMHIDAVQLALLHHEYGTWLGKQAQQFIEANNLGVDWIASHGHTIFHQPELGLTLQIGSGQHLAMEVGVPVICDFRSMDVALGGQGAPLVPMGDRLLFSDFDYCLNLGGISNMSFERNGQRMAYDIGLANMVLNYLVNKLGKTYDENGEIAAAGSFDEALFNSLNALEYFKLPFPKSTGREWFDHKVIPVLEQSKADIASQLHTACHQICYQVGQSIQQLQSESSPKRLLVTGGGAKNKFLMDCLKSYLPESVQLHIPSEDIIDYKEAIVFALLGILRMRGEANTLSTVTGASRNESCGVVFYPKNEGKKILTLAG